MMMPPHATPNGSGSDLNRSGSINDPGDQARGLLAQITGKEGVSPLVLEAGTIRFSETKHLLLHCSRTCLRRARTSASSGKDELYSRSSLAMQLKSSPSHKQIRQKRKEQHTLLSPLLKKRRKQKNQEDKEINKMTRLLSLDLIIRVEKKKMMTMMMMLKAKLMMDDLISVLIPISSPATLKRRQTKRKQQIDCKMRMRTTKGTLRCVFGRFPGLLRERRHRSKKVKKKPTGSRIQQTRCRARRAGGANQEKQMEKKKITCRNYRKTRHLLLPWLREARKRPDCKVGVFFRLSEYLHKG